MHITSIPLSKVYELLEGAGSHSISALCKKMGKFGMFIALDWHAGRTSDDGYIQAAPYLRYPENEHVLQNGIGYFLFDHEDDMRHAFDITIGDRGPTTWNDYAGPAKVYAVICDSQGVQIDENA